MNCQFENILGRFYYQNQCNTIIIAAEPVSPGVGRGNRRQGENDRRGVSEWRKIWINGHPNEGRSPKSGHQMAAEGMQFPWPWDGGTISTNLDVIWGMSDYRRYLHLHAAGNVPQ